MRIRADRIRIHGTAFVEDSAKLGAGTVVWRRAHVRHRAKIGRNCVVGMGAYVGVGVLIGDNCKVQNYACVYMPAILQDGVFVGPHAVLANDRRPRAVNPDGTLKEAGDWEMEVIVVRRGASIGAGAVVLPGVEVGEWAMVGAGAVVTRDIPAHALVVGVPAVQVGFVDEAGRRMEVCHGCFDPACDGFKRKGK